MTLPFLLRQSVVHRLYFVALEIGQLGIVETQAGFLTGNARRRASSQRSAASAILVLRIVLPISLWT